MAITATKTYTNTFTRIEVLAFQMNYVVKRTTNSETFEQIVEKGIVQNQWIDVVTVNAIDAQGKLHAKIIMRIDWDQHKLQIDLNNNAIPLKEALPEGERLSVAIGMIVKYFCKKVEEMGLITSWIIQYRFGIDAVRARKELGTVPASEPQWASGEIIHVWGEVPEQLDEFSIDLSVIVPEGEQKEKISKKRGVVKWFNESKGFGFIESDEEDEDLFVHYSQILGSGFRTLVEGQVVEFDVEKHIKGLRAVNVAVIE